MNKNIGIILAVGVVILTLAFVLLQNNEPQDRQTETLSPNQDLSQEATTTNSPEPAEEPEQPTSDGETRYIEYSPGVIENNIDKKLVLFFYADWCPTCRPADKEISARQGQIPGDALVIRVNYNDSDTERELARTYDVTTQHTFVFLENAEEKDKWVGGSLDRILQAVGRSG